MDKKKTKNKDKIVTVARDIISEDEDGSKIFVSKKETADARIRVLEFTSSKPITDEEFLGLLAVYLEQNAAELATLSCDSAHCH